MFVGKYLEGKNNITPLFFVHLSGCSLSSSGQPISRYHVERMKLEFLLLLFWFRFQGFADDAFVQIHIFHSLFGLWMGRFLTSTFSPLSSVCG